MSKVHAVLAKKKSLLCLHRSVYHDPRHALREEAQHKYSGSYFQNSIFCVVFLLMGLSVVVLSSHIVETLNVKFLWFL